MVTNNQSTNQPTNQPGDPGASKLLACEKAVFCNYREYNLLSKCGSDQADMGFLLIRDDQCQETVTLLVIDFQDQTISSPAPSSPVIDSLTHFDSSVMQIQQQC